MRTAFAVLLAALAVVGVGAAARDHRPAPFGDAVAVHRTALAAGPGTLRLGAADSVRFTADAATGPGATLWSYRRPGSRPVRLFPLAGGITVAVWDDGMLTGIRTGGDTGGDPGDTGDGPVVGWHRFVPGLADWLRRPTGLGPLLVPLDHGGSFLLPTPDLVMSYTSADGSIRTDTLPPRGCAYDPARTLVQPGGPVLLPRPCRAHSTVEAFGPDGRLWQAPAGPLARPVAAGPGAVGVLDVPLLRPRLLSRDTGRPLPLTVGPRPPR
ncbi:hypothetical protein [Streptacidiphilus cavernicola]|uniref:Uncharacterized protein n=1 Tax=Streptacidiphilus cavernicola TaxID=3342716 RepID=A0ABV6W143_9ACTN